MVSSAPDGVGYQLEVAHSSALPKSGTFRVESRPSGDTIVVAPVGALDVGTVDDLDQALHRVVDGGCRDLVLDLRGLSVLDSSGLHLVLSWNALTVERGITFAVVQGGPQVRRVFEIVGVIDSLPFVGLAADGQGSQDELKHRPTPHLENSNALVWNHGPTGIIRSANLRGRVHEKGTA